MLIALSCGSCLLVPHDVYVICIYATTQQHAEGCACVSVCVSQSVSVCIPCLTKRCKNCNKSKYCNHRSIYLRAWKYGKI